MADPDVSDEVRYELIGRATIEILKDLVNKKYWAPEGGDTFWSFLKKVYLNKEGNASQGWQRTKALITIKKSNPELYQHLLPWIIGENNDA